MTLPNPNRPDPEVIRILRQYRQALDAQEVALMATMADRWLEIERALEAEISLLAHEIIRRRGTGEVVTEQMIWRMKRYRILQEHLEDQIKRYNSTFAVRTISEAQRTYALLGIDAAQNAINISYGALGRYFHQINIGAVESMIGFAGDGSPLYNLLQFSYPDAVDGLLQALVKGIGTGKGAVQIAQDMSDGLGMGFSRAVLIARTETLRAYRTASTEQYRQSGVVTGFKRLVKKETACVACLGLDGQRFELAEELTDHPRGKCQAVPIVEGVSAPKWELGQTWFKTLPAADQLERLGPKRYQLYKTGQATLADMAKMTRNNTWGDSPRVATVAELTE